MPDVYKQIRPGNIDNGFTNVRISDLIQPTGIPPKATQQYIVLAQSGTLETRFDDTTYYTA
jgi:hypothetical protein